MFRDIYLSIFPTIIFRHPSADSYTFALLSHILILYDVFELGMQYMLLHPVY
jgi:hypothetical protein